MAKPDKQARKAALDRRKADQRAAARSALPLERDDMKAMFAWLDNELATKGCDHTLRLTEKWLREAGQAEKPVLAWLRDNGGHCDCEAHMNAEEKWLDAIHDVDW